MTYSCHDLGLTQQLALKTEDYEPNAKQQAHLLELVRAKGVKNKKKLMILEPYSEKAALETARYFLPVVRLRPYGSRTEVFPR